MITGNHPFLLIVFIIFVLSAALQIFYYFYYYLTPALFKTACTTPAKDPVSVIICARNEEQNLREFLPSVLEQEYPDYEVIVVNDCSDDDSYNVLGEYINKYPNLRVSNISKDPKFTHNKKFAQFIGIKAAKNEMLLFIDADCRPETGKWLGKMVSHFDDKTDFVLGYGGYFRKKGLLNKYIRYDSMFIAMQYLGMAIRGVPYMGVGRNLAYRRSVFFKNTTRYNVSVEFGKEAHTRSIPSANITELFKQKKRHLTTAVHYKLRDKVLLTAEPASRILFYVFFILLLYTRFLWPGVTAVFGIRLAVQAVVLTLVQKKLNEQGIVPWSIFFDIFSPFINSVIYLTNLGGGSRKHRWN
jgi:glycosyltransferase involved in cell wall biosynthesis